MGPGDLQDVLGDLRDEEHADLLVGLGRSDDAAVYRVTDDVAIVETVDFFPPIVDDPYLFGAIAAANSMSDVYAMGGQVLFALNVAGFPRELPKDIIAAVFRGGADKVHEAGGVIAGGHTVVDAEPKYGLCVTGRVDPRRILIKGGLRAGQRVFLSKPLGTGVIATAAKNDKCEPAVLDGAVQSMLRLNRVAARVAQEAGATGATDITGFGLLGHASEMVLASGRPGSGAARTCRSCRVRGRWRPRTQRGWAATAATSRRTSGASTSIRRCPTRSSRCSASRKPRAASSSRSMRSGPPRCARASREKVSQSGRSAG